MAVPAVADDQLPEKTRRPRNRCRKLKSRVAMRNFYEVIKKNCQETKEELAAMEKHRAGDETFGFDEGETNPLNTMILYVYVYICVYA